MVSNFYKNFILCFPCFFILLLNFPIPYSIKLFLNDNFLTQRSFLGFLFFCFSVFLDKLSTCVLNYLSTNFYDFQGNDTRGLLNIVHVNFSQCPLLFTTWSFSHFPFSITSPTTLEETEEPFYSPLFIFPIAIYLLHE